MPVTTSTAYGRSGVLFPDFQHEGGNTLHSKVSGTFGLKYGIKALSDSLPCYFESVVGLANAGVQNLPHNFSMALTELSVLIWIGGVLQTSAQVSTNFTIAQVDTNTVSVTNISGSSKTFNVMVFSFQVAKFQQDVLTVKPGATKGVDTETSGLLKIGGSNSTGVELARNNTQVYVQGLLSLLTTTDSTTTGALARLTAPQKSFVRLTNASLTSINRIQSPSDGIFLVLTNATGNSLTLANLNGAETAEQIITGASNDISILDGASVTLIYDAVSLKWRIVGGAGGSISKTFNKNYLINGNFIIWQRSTSQTSSGYGSDDRWVNGHFLSTKTHSRQSFADGQTAVPGNPKYFSRTVVTTAGTADCFCIKDQRIKDVRSFAGETITLSFWAKSDANRSMSIEFEQYFGSGGSPSAFFNFGQEKISLSTSWQKFVKTVNVPSLSGKTLGTNDDHFFQLSLWLEGGSSYNSRTQNLGNQSGTFDLAQIQIERGSVANDFEYRTENEELDLCLGFFEKSDNYDEGGQWWSGQTTNAVIYYSPVRFIKQKISKPTVTITASNAASFGTPTVRAGVNYPTRFGFVVQATASATTGDNYYRTQWTAESEL